MQLAVTPESGSSVSTQAHDLIQFSEAKMNPSGRQTMREGIWRKRDACRPDV
jgi:hypothetical protein